MKMRRIRMRIFAAVLVCFIFLQQGFIIQADEFDTEEFKISVVFAEKQEVYKVNAGDTISIKVPVRAVNGLVDKPYITPTCEEKGISASSRVSLWKENFTEEPTFISTYEKTYINFQMEISEKVATGYYDVYLKFDYMDANNNPKTYTMVEAIRIRVTGKPEPTPEPTPSPTPEPKLDPVLTISHLEHDGGAELRKGDTFFIYGTIKNIGELGVKTVQVSLEGFDTGGILKNYTTEKKELGTLQAGGMGKVSFPVYVSGAAVSGVKVLTMKVTGKTPSGAEITETSTISITLLEETIQTKRGEANLLIHSVKQSPSAPRAGGKLTLSFIIENQGASDAVGVKIEPTLTNTTFSPIGAEPYYYFKVIKAGEKKKITANYTVSKTVVDGLNEIPLTITYKDYNKDSSNGITSGKSSALSDVNQDNTDSQSGGENGAGDLENQGGGSGTDDIMAEVKSITAKLYVLNVKNPEKKETKQTTGVPKLIIKDFTSGEDSIRAGKEFPFSFDIHNTHGKLSAKNIKVTLTSEENAFSVAKGSNSFYISEIKPGETSHQVILLKAKADSVTKAYPLKIDFEYEYEGMPQLENQISTGLQISETLMLQVLENSRPVVSNIIVGTWEPPEANTPCNMSFDFRNMGKSTLYNVIAQLESKDYKSTLENVFIGNVEAGSGNTYEMEVTPLVEGIEANGVLIVTYEDSNGNSYNMKANLPAVFVNQQQLYNPDMDPNGDMSMDMPAEKKEIVPLWAFLLIQAGLFLLGIFTVRKIAIQIYKRKLRNKEENEL